jgi:hypothetical protein
MAVAVSDSLYLSRLEIVVEISEKTGLFVRNDQIFIFSKDSLRYGQVARRAGFTVMHNLMD